MYHQVIDPTPDHLLDSTGEEDRTGVQQLKADEFWATYVFPCSDSEGLCKRNLKVYIFMETAASLVGRYSKKNNH